VTSLPIAPTRTAFCSAIVDLDHILPGAALYLDGNSKVTAGNGSYEAPAPNAFSLPAASVERERDWPGVTPPPDCPGSTAVCRSSCYVRGLAKHAPDLYDHYRANAEHLEALLEAPLLGFRAAMALAVWIREHASAGFRWHVSGDVWHVQHAEWIRDVCMLAPDVPMWIYTRTLGTVATLRTAHNLAVNVSADRENYAEARRVALEHGARVTYLVHGDDARPDPGHVRFMGACGGCTGVPDDLPPGSVIFPDYALRGRDLADPTSAPWWQALTHEQRKMVCSVDYFGQSEANRCGPCSKCLT
jgi:hypothetical protein